jgi:hypothetical protein
LAQKDQQRLDAVHHIVHEYANFVSSAEMVKTGLDIEGVGIKPPINTHISHAFYLNCRKLADFFQNEKGGDDVMAEHYVPGFKASLPACDNWRVPMNKQLAHVSYFRDGADAREIDRAACEELYEELRATWKAFRKALPEPFRSEFSKKIEERKRPYRNGQPSEFRHYDLD